MRFNEKDMVNTAVNYFSWYKQHYLNLFFFLSILLPVSIQYTNVRVLGVSTAKNVAFPQLSQKNGREDPQ